jgi:hypothetical protein
VVQEWLSLEVDVELIDWSPRTPDMNHIENMWSEVKRTVHKAWSFLLFRNFDALWTLVSNT